MNFSAAIPPEPCDAFALLVQADHDGELDAAAAAALVAHVSACPGCAALRDRLGAQSRALRDALPRHVASPALRAALAAKLSAPATGLPPGPRRRRPAMLAFGGFGTGAAVAATFLLLLRAPAPDPGLLASHLRALQPGHLMDVVSTDRHTVKPWFDGRIGFAPPVQDFAGAGYPLLGARLDYLGPRQVAVLVYGHAKHVIDLYVWPARGTAAPRTTQIDGYRVAAWTQDGFAHRAITDADPPVLASFVALWHPAR